MRYIALLLLLLLPPMGQAQIMKCPDGSYRDRCAGGELFQGDEISRYAAPAPGALTPLRDTRPDTGRSRIGSGAAAGALPPPTPGPSSVAERARGMGISRNALVKARSRGTLLIGMEEKDVVDILGEPDEVKGRTGARCRRMSWQGSRERPSHTVTLCDGRVEQVR